MDICIYLKFGISRPGDEVIPCLLKNEPASCCVVQPKSFMDGGKAKASTNSAACA